MREFRMLSAKLICRFFGHKKLKIPATFRNPMKKEIITRIYDCPRCWEQTFETCVHFPERRVR